MVGGKDHDGSVGLSGGDEGIEHDIDTAVHIPRAVEVEIHALPLGGWLLGTLIVLATIRRRVVSVWSAISHRRARRIRNSGRWLAADPGSDAVAAGAATARATA